MEKGGNSVTEPKAQNVELRFKELRELGSYFQEAADNDERWSHSQGTEPVSNQGTFSVPGLSRCDNIYLPRCLSASDYAPPILHPFTWEPLL